MKKSRIKKKPTEWDLLRPKIKERFWRAKITRCEICGGTFAMSFAHAVKRRFLRKIRIGELLEDFAKSPENIETVILVCQMCHDKLDLKMTHEEMKNQVMGIINKRKIQP